MLKQISIVGTSLTKKEMKSVQGGNGRNEPCLYGFYTPATCENDSDCEQGQRCDPCTAHCVIEY